MHDREVQRKVTSGKRGRLLWQPFAASSGSGRIEAIDLARGVAVSLMILSHGIKGLLEFEQMPEWGLVPIHLFTKFASSLFIMVFGIALALAFLPHAGTDRWPEKRRKLLINGLVVFFWYKALTVAEMLLLAEPEQILATLLYVNFPSFVEILGFYALALMWVPFLLPLWKRSPLVIRLASPLLLVGLTQLLFRHFDFWGIPQLEAILIEHEDYYAWGQISRGPLIFLGLLVGELILNFYGHTRRRLTLAGIFAGISTFLLVVFLVLAGSELAQHLDAIARNAGKHPPQLMFMLFSLGGAFAVLALTMLGGEGLARLLKPITIIGSDALNAFIFHIIVIFVGFRYLLGYWQSIDYGYAMTLTLLTILGTAFWIKLTSWVQAIRS